MIDLTKPAELRSLLERHGLAPQRKWGQHFLVSPKVVGLIVGAVEDCAGILEVGPGPGVLTAPLSQDHPLIAYEVDPVAVSALAETAPQAVIRHEDVLTQDLASALANLPEPQAIVSNMPYNITGPLLDLFAEQRSKVVKMVLMMQLEVGAKILAPAGDRTRGAISVLLQAQFEIRRLARVPASCFYPPPKVESIVLELTPRSDEAQLPSEIVRAAFKQPRKTLANNLTAFGWSRETAEDRIRGCGLSPSIRPHQLSESDWTKLLS